MRHDSESTLVSRLQYHRLPRSADSMDPQTLTDSMRFIHIFIFQSLLLRSPRMEFLENLVTEDEIWVLRDSNADLAVWLFRREETPTQEMSNVHYKKCVHCCFWDSKGMLYYELPRQGIRSRLSFDHSAPETLGSHSGKAVETTCITTSSRERQTHVLDN